MSDTIKPTGEKIMIETMTDLANAVTPENYERLVVDLNKWLASCVYTKIAHGSFHHAAMEWTDDGDNTITGQNITFTNNPKQP